MMYTSPKFESEEAARSQVEPLQIQPRLILKQDGCRCGGCVPKHCKNSFFARGLSDPQTMRTATGSLSKPVRQ